VSKGNLKRVRADRRAGNYKTIGAHIHDDRSISLQAKGLFGIILTRPEGWKIHLEDIVSRSTNGDHSTRKALRELEAAGYIVRDKERQENGAYEWQWTAIEDPSTPQFSGGGATPQKPRGGDDVSGNKTTTPQLSTGGLSTGGLSTGGKPSSITVSNNNITVPKNNTSSSITEIGHSSDGGEGVKDIKFDLIKLESRLRVFYQRLNQDRMRHGLAMSMDLNEAVGGYTAKWIKAQIENDQFCNHILPMLDKLHTEHPGQNFNLRQYGDALMNGLPDAYFKNEPYDFARSIAERDAKKAKVKTGAKRSALGKGGAWNE
jgi:hypothetical protein